MQAAEPHKHYDAMKTLLIVVHSMTDGTRQMADAALAGAAREPEVRTRLLRAPQAGPAEVLAADGYMPQPRKRSPVSPG